MNKEKLRKRSDRLRSSLPASEVWFWDHLKKSGLCDLNDLSNHVFGRFIYDYANLKIGLFLEVDGSIHNLKSVQENDKKKETLILKSGFKFLRISAFCSKDLEQALKHIRALKHPRIIIRRK